MDRRNDIPLHDFRFFGVDDILHMKRLNNQNAQKENFSL
jgi:hypothetical protein